jgi:large subunit ribosomal protein L25
VLQKMRISCLPDAIPENIGVDISNLPFGSTHTKDLALPQGITLAEKPRVVVLTIKKPRGTAKEEAGAQAAPAAAGKPAAAKPAAAKPAAKK